MKEFILVKRIRGRKMQIITGSRQSGKTTKLIEFAHNKSIYIVCAERNRCFQIRQLANELGKNILMPVTVEELLNMRGFHSSIDFVVDELGHCFKTIFPDKKFLVANLTTEGEYPNFGHDELLAENQHLQTLLKSRDNTISAKNTEIQRLNSEILSSINKLFSGKEEMSKRNR